jgi:ankyrin repeat protein
VRTWRTFYGLGLALLWAGALAVVAADPAAPEISPDYRAVLRDGKARELRKALDAGAAVEARDAEGNTPLMLAAVYGDVPCMKLLVERGAEVNTRNAAGATPLMRASFDADKVQLLLARGAEVNAHSGLGNTALMLAARLRDSHRTVEALLSRGADPNATNLWGATALMAAAAGGDNRSIELLLKHGAKPNAQPGMSQPGFIFGGGRSALMWASYRGQLSTLKLLLDRGADVNSEGMLGTPLSQAVWADHADAARFLIEHGAEVNHLNGGDSFSPLHWAASSERNDPALVKVLLSHGADPNLDGGGAVDAFLAVPQTPLMLARCRGKTRILQTLLASGATNETPDTTVATSLRALPDNLEPAAVRAAISRAIPPLQRTSLESKQAFVNHASHQDCVSCHQQFLPLAAIGQARKRGIPVDLGAEAQLVKIVTAGELKNPETDFQALFHPEPVHTKGYALFGYAGADLPADEYTDGAVHHLAAIQAPDGRWFNNLPRPPIQSSDVGATSLAIHALQRYPLPGRRAEFARRVDEARRWLSRVQPVTNEERIYQLLGLSWAGESPRRMKPLRDGLLAQQHTDGGWSQLPTLGSDAYATGQAIYALKVSTLLLGSSPALERGRKYLLSTQLEDGTWHVHRRAFPFQPTMRNSGFPHGRDAWLSAAATSWAVLALTASEESEMASR